MAGAPPFPMVPMVPMLPMLPMVARNELDPYKQLWAERPSEEVRLKQYRFVDEGPTVLVMLDLNDHLPIGHDASAAVA